MSEFLRQPESQYFDPLSLIWLDCARKIGFEVKRSHDVYASYDGQGTIYIGDEQLLDPDDCLAQMIFHELCHALVEGDEGEKKIDWGLDNAKSKNPWREHGTLRLQALLAEINGLRDFFAPTTDFRVTFWPTLGADPFWVPPEQGGPYEKGTVAGRKAWWRASLPRWQPLHAALQATAALAQVVTNSANLAAFENSIWALLQKPLPMHVAGPAPVRPGSQHTCSACAWYDREEGERCRRNDSRLPAAAPACILFEPASLDCLRCQACSEQQPGLAVCLQARRQSGYSL